MATSSLSMAAAVKALTITDSNPSLLCKTSTDVHSSSVSMVAFKVYPKPKFRLFTKGLQPSWKCSTVLRAQSNEVAVGGSSNDAATVPTKPDTSKASEVASASVLATEESISEFITQVASLVKLVDSRDIVELHLKQLDCEVIIRKKEALPQPVAPAPVMMHHSLPPPITSPPPTSQPSALPAATSAAPPPPAKASKSSTPPLKCPMAGTLYRSPAPGEPPFVKVGDKVQKGQVICIIEAMKLMNEIEADRSGTITEILVEDGKPVSVDTPLFAIEP